MFWKKKRSASKVELTDLDKLTDVKDRWTRAETLESLTAHPTRENLEIVEKALNVLAEGEFAPYRKSVDPLDAYSACRVILYYAQADVFRTDPYAVQALIPHVGNQEDFLSRQLRSEANGHWLFAMYQLLKAQREISQRL